MTRFCHVEICHVKILSCWDFVMSRFVMSWFVMSWFCHVKILSCQDFCWYCQDESRNLDIIETFWVKKWLNSLDGLRNLDKKMQNYTNFSIKIETSSQKMPKFPGLNEFLDLHQNFLVWTLMMRQNWNWSRLIFFDSQDKFFWKCQDFLDCCDKLVEDVEIEILDQDMIKTNWDTQT